MLVLQGLNFDEPNNPDFAYCNGCINLDDVQHAGLEDGAIIPLESICDLYSHKGLTYADELREYNAGHLNMLTIARPLAHIIPPHYETVRHYAYIPPDCTARGIPNENELKTYIIASMLHLHLIGKSTQISIIRNGKQLEPFDSNFNWDFNYQQFTRLHDEIQLLPNDAILLECNYTSINKNNITYGGLSTKDEMCTDNMYIYPVSHDFNFVETVYSGYNLESIAAWLTQAKAKGFISGDIPYVTDLWNAYRGMVKHPNLQWHDIDGAKDFYDELFTNPLYNKLNIVQINMLIC